MAMAAINQAVRERGRVSKQRAEGTHLLSTLLQFQAGGVEQW